MIEADSVVDAERQLMLAYVPPQWRAAIGTLWQLDARLGDVVATTSEPAVGAIRLAWWRDALLRLDEAPAPAEPLLRAVAEKVLPRVAGATLATLPEGWGAVLDADPSDVALDSYGLDRGATLFAAAADLLHAPGEAVRAPGAGWALVDLAHGSRDRGLRIAALAAAGRAMTAWDGRVPRGLRPLGMLGMLARIDVAAGPDVQRRQGAPSRIARMMRYRMIGR
ncbi:MAG TPA: squalene/phytoene synthase family protein [Sphingomonas sp.]|uniref:squalene/phytoene synthase family protein n=1 Tax=Sphingomonas sp. TaxID=28214 RepID=UPI002ED87BFD